MKMLTRGEYWSLLSPTRRCLLVLGMTIMSPVLVALLLFAGSIEAFKFLTETKYKE